MVAAIDVADLRKTYGSTAAVDGVTFEVRTGEFFGILGPNGAGKTTTLEIIEGLRRADSGEVRLLGETPSTGNHGLLRRIGVQFQTSAFFERLTVREQIHTFATLYRLPLKRADEWVERVGLGGSTDVRTEDLSGGQLQRLAIACALINEPEVVFLDEPTAALDPQSRRNLWDLLLSLNEAGRTVVLTTHYMDEAETLCDRVAIMDEGKILQLDSPAALVRRLDAPIRISLPAGEIDRATAEAMTGVESCELDDSTLVLVTHTPEPVIGELAREGRLEGLQVKGGTLEDVFLDLTGREYRA
jgi:ABC-2 type transport system ATP-binding protein